MNCYNEDINLWLYFYSVILLAFLLFGCKNADPQSNSNYPSLLLTQKGIKKIKKNKNNPLIKRAVAKIKKEVNKAINTVGVEVPVPRGKGAGPTHFRHKKNGYLLYQSGLLYQITGKEKYAMYARKMFLAYAKLYPTLGIHPHPDYKKSPGRLFWQTLNESVWLVYVIQAYDLLYNYLKPTDRAEIENNLLLPMAKFLSVGRPYNFDRIHNHAAWAGAAVGMTGYVLGKKNLVQMSLYGLHKDGKSGFYALTDQLFSPDGYYKEGPYYQRYAMMPFMIFAATIKKYDPSRDIFNYRNGVLLKAPNALIQMTGPKGYFFPIDDAIISKGWRSPEVILSVDMAYAYGGRNPMLLNVAQKQGVVSLTDAGAITAIAWAKDKGEPFVRKSVFLSDGIHGKKGGIGILRYGRLQNQISLVMKATTHGMGHGHFDELNTLVYDNGGKLMIDYGSVRFLNIPAKSGGRYLPQNDTWAKQTIAHNSIVIDGDSQYNGDVEEVSLSTSHPAFNIFSASDSLFQYMSAIDTTAYPGVRIIRTMILSKLPKLKHPIIIDVINVKANKEHRYDIPFYYKGQLIEMDFPKTVDTQKLKPLGKKNGYQYLWLNGIGKPDSNNVQITWLKKTRFYTMTFLTDSKSRILFTTVGANDPHFNLRNEHGVILRQLDTGDHVFANIIEPHGVFNATEEFTINSYSNISDVSLTQKDKTVIGLKLSLKNGAVWKYIIPTNGMKSSETKFSYSLIKKKK